MSKAYKCDRCGECFDPFAVKDGDYFATIKQYYYQDGDDLTNRRSCYTDMDVNLCPGCSKDFSAFMDGEDAPIKEEILAEIGSLKRENNELKEMEEKFFHKTIPELKLLTMEDVKNADPEECRRMLVSLCQFMLYSESGRIFRKPGA